MSPRPAPLVPIRCYFNIDSKVAKCPSLANMVSTVHTYLDKLLLISRFMHENKQKCSSKMYKCQHIDFTLVHTNLTYSKNT